MHVFTLPTGLANNTVTNVLTFYFLIQRKHNLHHRCFAFSNIINHTPPHHASRPSPLQPTLVLQQSTTIPAASTTSPSFRNMRHNSSLTSRHSAMHF